MVLAFDSAECACTIILFNTFVWCCFYFSDFATVDFSDSEFAPDTLFFIEKVNPEFLKLSL